MVARELAGIGAGKLAVIAPTGRGGALGAAIASPIPGAAIGEDLSLRADVVVLDVRQAKGLEFDSVLIVDPQGIIDESPRGLNNLYVALTRATRRLGVLHPGELPAVLGRLTPRTT